MLTCLNNATIGAASFSAFLEAASGAGFEAVEVGVGSLEEYVAAKSLQSLREDLAEKKLALGSGGLPVDWRISDGELNDGMATLKRRLDLCRQLELTRLCTWVPPRWDTPYSEVWAFARKRFTLLADLFADYGLTLGLEFVAPMGGFLDKRFKFVSTMSEALHLVHAIGRPNVGLMLDSYHLHVAGTPLAELAALKADTIVQFHINDASPCVPREELADLRRLLPGEGAIPLVPMLLALKHTGYAWTLSVESFNDRVKALGPVEGARQTKAALDGVLAVVQ